MSNVPSAVDAMIWKLAESDDVAAQADFVTQYPEFKDELSRRTDLVKRLRGYPRSAPALPRFVPTTDLESAPSSPKWIMPVAATVLLAGVAYATFAVAKFISSNQADSSPIYTPNAPSPGSPDAPRLRGAMTMNRDSMAGGAPSPGIQRGEPSPTSSGATNLPQGTGTEAPKSRWDTPITLTSKDATLSSVALAVASGAHVTIELAPGMKDPVFSYEVHGKAARAVLEELGQQFGFGVMYESDKRAVLVPVNSTSPVSPDPSHTGKDAAPSIDLKVRPPQSGQLPAAPSKT